VVYCEQDEPLINREINCLFADSNMQGTKDKEKVEPGKIFRKRKRKLIIEYGLINLICMPMAGMWFHRKII